MSHRTDRFGKADLVDMDWADLTSTTAKTTRQKLYKFLLNRPEPVRELLRHLSAAEAEQLLQMLIDADNRRQLRLSKPEASSKSDPLADAILSS